jgi:hypothetical protein
MFVTIFRFFRFFIGIAFSILFCENTEAQENHLKLMMGAGYGHYFNSLSTVGNENISNNNPASTAKLIWQTEHKLRLGLESGYYFVYSTTSSNIETLNTRLSVIPMFLNVSMKVYKNFEVFFSTGYAAMLYKTESPGVLITDNNLSEYNISLGVLYNLPINKSFDLFTEIKYLYIGNTFDNHVSGLIGVSYKFLTWK